MSRCALTTAVTMFGTKLDVRITSVPGTTCDESGMVRAASGLEFRSEPWTTDDLPDLLRKILSSTAASTAAPALSSMLIYLLMAMVLVVRPEGLFPANRR